MNESEYSSAVRVLSSETDVFSDLVALTDLRPERDFRISDLRDVDFSGSDLSSFDLTRADLRRVRWQTCLRWPSLHRFAMMGKGNSPITANDYERLVDLTTASKLWSERFLSFALIVDNFGESNLVFDVLKKIIMSDSSTYMKVCSYVYFAASFVDHPEGQDYCFALAYEGNAYSNMFRIKKARRISEELKNYVQSLDRDRIRFPGEVAAEDVAGVYKKWDMG